MKTATAQLLEQRSCGALTLAMGKTGPQIIREAGASKIRLPRGSTQAIVINTGGGLAGGDIFEHNFVCAPEASLTLTSQAAERVYQTLGPPAKITTRMQLDNDATLFWLPQETILYEGASLTRRYDVKVKGAARFLSVEPIVFGRTESGEKLLSVHVKDCWRIWREGHLIHAEDSAIGPDLPASKATLGGAAAMATVIYVNNDAEAKLEAMQKICAASAWNGKLIARFVSQDGYALRKALIPAITVLAGAQALPKIWTA